MNVWMLGLAAVSSFGAQDPVLTLDEAIKIADANAFSVKSAESSVERAQAVVRQGHAQIGPKLSVGSTYTRFDKELTTSFGGGDPIVIRPIDSSTATVTLSLPVLFSRSANLGISASRSSVRAAKATLEAARNTLKLNVRQGYYRVVQAKWQVDVAKQTVENAQKRLANAEIRERAGDLAKIDVLRFQTEVAQRKGDLVAAENGLDLAKSAFNNVLGRQIDTSFSTEEIPAFQPSVDTPANLEKQAVQSRPELESLRQQLITFTAIRKAEGFGMDPSLSFSLTNSRNLGNLGFGGSQASTTGVLSLNIPIYDSGLARARRQAAEEDERQAKIRLDQATLGISLEVRQATISLSNALSQLSIATEQDKFAAETYRLSVVRYDAGEGIQLEVIDAQTQLTAAETALVAARYNVLIAYAQLQAAIGADAVPTGSTTTNGDKS